MPGPSKRSLLTCVGVMWVMSSDASCFNTVVLPALSNPRRRILTSWSGALFNLRRIDSKPCVIQKKRRNYLPSIVFTIITSLWPIHQISGSFRVRFTPSLLLPSADLLQMQTTLIHFPPTKSKQAESGTPTLLQALIPQIRKCRASGVITGTHAYEGAPSFMWPL